MENKFSKFINLQGKYLTSLLILLALSIGNVWGQTGTYTTRAITNSDLTSQWSFNVVSGSAVSLGTDETTDNGMVFIASGSGNIKFQTSSYFSCKGKSNIYIPVPAGSAGSISHTVSSSSDSRYFQLFVNGTAGTEGQRLYSKLNAGGITSDGKKGPQTFNFTSSDITTHGGKTYLHLQDNNTEMKIASFTVTLTTGSYASTTYSVTYALNGGTGTTPTETNKAAGAKFTLHNGTTDITAPTDKEFDKWKDQDNNLYAGGAEYTMPAKAVTLTAQWKDAGAASNDATLSALSVAGCTLNETFAPATENYTVDLPFYASMPAVGDVTATKNDANAATPAVSISGNVITIACEAEDGTTTKTYTITVTIASVPTASSSINIEQLVLDNGTSYNIGAALDAAHIGYVDKDALDTLNESKSKRNEPFLGLKFKKTTSKVTIIVPASTDLNVKFGSVDGSAGLQVSVNGSAAAAPSLTSGVYTLAASAGVKEVVFTQTGAKTVVYKQIMIGEAIKSVTLPWRVTYSVDGSKGSCAKASEVWTGTALTLPTVTPESGWNFDGWIDDEDNPVSSPYTPAKNVTLAAQFTADASGTDLDALTYQIGSGSPVAVGYSAGTFTYNIELPYAVYPTITVAATPVSGASIKDDATKILTVSSFPGTATFTVTDGVDDQLYTVNFTRAPKDGVSIIKATISGGNAIGEVTGLYKKSAATGGLSSGKFNGKGAYIGLTLEDGQTFDEGDIINVHTTTASQQGTIALYDDHGNDVTPFHDYGEMGGLGDNKYALPAAADTKSTIYVCRTNANTWNGYVDYIEVTRPINPMLTAITINGEAGVIDEDLKTVAVELQPGYNLAALTIVPTIVSNTPQANVVTTVTTNSGAWIIGDNTYRLTDKDGDYTEYTITLTAGQLKHNVTFNTHGGSAVAPQKVVDGENPVAPADPEKEDYLFQYWSLTDGGTEVDVTSIVIDKDTTFHAVWAPDGAIKLLDGSTVNTTNFITGVEATTVNFDDADHNCVIFVGTVSGVNGVKDLDRVIAYNATTTQTRIQLSLHNTSTNSRQVLVKGVVEGSADVVDIASITLGNQETVTTAYYNFDNASNRTIYIFVPNTAGNVCFLQVKVIESGTALPMFGQAGYSLNLNKGRIFGRAPSAISNFEGLHVESLGADYQPTSSTVGRFALGKSISFDVASPVTLSLNSTTSKAYYVTKDAAGTDNETTKTGVSEFALTAGTWYITAGAEDMQFTNIAFTLPKCEQPTITTQPATKVDFAAGDMTATVVAEVSDGGTLSYQWYDASDDSEVAGATAATLTTTTEGTYYVIVTNSKADHQSQSVQSDNATLRYRKADDATLSALSYGDPATAITLTDGVYEYDVYLPEGTTDVPALSATASMAAYGATAVPTNAAAFVSYEATSTVLVTAEDHTTTQTYTVNFHVAHAIATLVDVTGDMFWDFSKANDGSAASKNLCSEEILSNVSGINNNSDFKSDNIMATANKFSGGKLQASMIKFHTTVDGVIKVICSNTGSKSTERYLAVNGKKTDTGSKNTTAVTYYGFVKAGDVALTVVEGDGNMMNFTSVKFIAKTAVDYARDAAHGDDWMAPGELGTTCIPQGAVAVGGELYELVGKNDAGKIVFASVDNNHMAPGKPYLFQAKSNAMNFYYTDEDAASEPDNSGAMKGSFTNYTLTELANVYYFAGHALWSCSDLDHLDVIANRAFVKMDEVTTLNPAASPAPGRRYIVMNVNGKDAATGIDEITNDQSPITNKVLINGQLFILRGEKIFDATGRLVK